MVVYCIIFIIGYNIYFSIILNEWQKLGTIKYVNNPVFIIFINLV